MARSVPLWFREAKYGLFIHWGIYSVLERGEQVLYREHLRPSEYRKLADRFRPHRFAPDHWASVARRAHMRYALFTTKHHDGFCMWDTATTEFNAAQTGLRRDYVAEYADAFRRAGMKIGFYFSTADWSQPAYFTGPRGGRRSFDSFIRCTHEQVRELCTCYGKIDVFWFDGVWPYTAKEWKAAKLVAMIRRLQPGIIVNDRIGLEGDFATPEQSIPEQQFKPRRKWESCMTSTESWWGYHAGVRWKSDLEAIRDLCRVAEVGGNLVYNVGPKPDGTLPRQFETLMRKVGEWLDTNGEAIFGTTETICDTRTFGLMTCGRQRVYLHVLYWPRSGELHLAGLRNNVRGVRLLADDVKLRFRQSGPHLYITGLPRHAPDPRNTVIAVDVVGKPASHPWARERIWTGALERTQTHSQRVAARLAAWSKT
jgi:alpha-L-fucosidase